MMLPVEGGEEVQVLPRVRGFDVTRKGIYFSVQNAIQFLDKSSGKVSTLATDRTAHLCASPDNTYLLYPQVDRDFRDLMLIEGFR
jgi:hypothetical protein